MTFKLENLSRDYFGVAGIYAIFSNNPSRIYVGSSINMYKRVNMHINHLKRGVHYNTFLQSHFNKYGEASMWVSPIKAFYHEITSKELREYEQIYIDLFYDDQSICFNLSKNAEHFSMSDKGKDSFKKKMKDNWKNNKKELSKVVIKNLEKARKKRSDMIAQGVKFKNHMKGKKHSKESIDKMRKSAIKRGRQKAVLVPVDMYSKDDIFIKSFSCLSDAARALGFDPRSSTNIGKVCKGERHIALGYKWRYSST